jgi:TRAP-type C4-dicarboxylate transport system substrate-binding protein
MFDWNGPGVRGRAVALCAALCLAPGLASAEARELRFGLITPPSHVWTKVAQRMAERLPEASGGALELAVFPAGQLGSEQEMFQQMSFGLLDVGLMTAAITSLRAPSMAGWFTPYLFDGVPEAIAAADAPAAQEMLDELSRANLVGLGYTFAGMRHILMREGVVHSPADLANKKIRIVPFPAGQVWWNAVGAVPTPVNLGEVYSGLQSGLLDGIDIDLDALVGLKFQEVGKGLTLSNHMTFPAVLVVSQLTWDTLSDAEKAAFTEVADEALAWGSRQQIEAEKKNIATLEAEIETGRIPDAETAFAAANQAFQERFGADPVVARFQQQVQAQEVTQ